ncbi:MAG: START-like domain-containing protein [Bacteroidales bacterium]|nr:START-like domain-containing protein [Bacteroidales bacterium]
MGKEKIHLEFMLKAGSGNIVWSIISTPSGLETWFADKVTAKDKIFTFRWGKTETRQAEVANFRTNSFIRFHWLDDEDPKTYFELRMVYNELTSDYMLEVIDWTEPDEKEDMEELWQSEIEKLKRVSGL